MRPDYEVRLQLNPATVLNADHELNDTVISAFNLTQTATKINVQFLETDCKDIHTAGWSARIRKTENEDNLELTYKKRYAITNGDIDAAISIASKDGFNIPNTKYKAQVEWGYQTQTLSITRKKNVASANRGTDLPGLEDSRKMLIDEALDKFNDWKSNKGWGTSELKKSRIYGPVLVRRSIGIWNALQLLIEGWAILGVVFVYISEVPG